MRIEHLEARNFRNLAPVNQAIEPGFVVVRGPNAQGKTNLLEALYVCATGRSFRSAAPKDLIVHGGDGAFLKAQLVRQDVRHHIEISLSPKKRLVKVDGRGLRKTSQLLDLVNVVAFFPDDLRIVKGSPDERRRFLDRAVANYRSDLIDASSHYSKALRSRNALLKGKTPVTPELLAVYDEQLANHGEVIHRCRAEALDALHEPTMRVFSELMGGTAELDLSLAPGFALTNLEHYKDDLLSALAERRTVDRARGITTRGPHRSDLLLTLDGHDARSFASQGQQRSMVLALKLAEVQTLSKALQSPPVLLLDDVSSELDARRTEMLFRVIAKLGPQVWVSTTGAAQLPLPKAAQILEMKDGVLTPV